MTDPIIQQLNRVYYEEEDWAKDKIDEGFITFYHEEAIRRGNIFYVHDNGRLLGYYETWRINAEQLGRMVLNLPMPIDKENTTDGNIAVVCNVWIDKEHRNSKVYKIMRNKWFEQNSHCDYYCGHAQRKRVGMWKVFTKDKLKSSLFRVGE